MRNRLKIEAIEKVIHTNRIIRRVGLDTDVMIALIDDLEQFSMFKPKIFSRNNVLYINYKVFSELMGHFIYRKGLNESQSRDKIFSYLRKNRIRLIKKKETDFNKLNEIIESLKKQRRILNNLAGDKDLEIISIYKVHGIDLIFSRNSGHFESFCNYLGIVFEKLQENIDMMWRQVFGWKRRGKYKRR